MEFTKILNKKLEEIERPPLPPVGTYVMKVTKVPEQMERGDYKIIEFNFSGIEAMEDVDADELAAFGPVTNVMARRAFMFGDDETSNDRAIFNLKRFLEEHLLVEDAESIQDGLAASPNHQCLVTLAHNQDKNDPEVYHVNVKATAPA